MNQLIYFSGSLRKLVLINVFYSHEPVNQLISTLKKN